MKKKLLSVLLAMLLLATCIPLGAVSISAANMTPEYVKSQLDSLKANSTYKPGNKNPPSHLYRNGTYSCFGFVDLLCRKIFGHNLASQKSSMELYTTNFSKIGSTLSQSAGNLSESSLKTLLSNAKTGDVVQMDYTNYSGKDSRHTMMVYSVTSSGVVFYHAGSSNIFFGQSSGKEPLWGTGGAVLTWDNLYKRLCSSDDGISLYRSTTMSNTHTHIYSNACDATCNICGATRSVGDHVWNTNVCGAAYCIYCETGQVTFHTYTNACDTTCNTCGTVRSLNHIYMDTPKTADVTYGGECVNFIFSPTKTMTYTFFSGSTVDTFGYILDADGNELARNDDDGEEQNFCVSYYMVAGESYILRACYYKASLVGSFPVTVTHKHVFDGACDAFCNTCEEIRVADDHIWRKGNCSVCGANSYPYKVFITEEPATAAYAPKGKNVSVKIGATGDDLRYAWYVKNDGATKYVKSAITTNTYSAKMSDTVKSRRIYCVITDKYGNQVTTKTFILRECVSLHTEPATAAYAQKGNKVSVKITASGDGLKYAWYVKNEGQTKYSKSAITSATYSTTMSDKAKGRRIYCVVKDEYGKQVTTKTFILRESVSLVSEPATATYTKNGAIAKITIKVSGDDLKYTWYVKNEGKSSYTKSSVTSATYSCTMSNTTNNRRVYCVITDKYGNAVTTKTMILKKK